MASLAPGNGWFPHRAYDARRSVYVPSKPTSAGDNVYLFPPTRAAPMRANPPHGPLARLLAATILEYTRAGRSAAWVIAWCLFGIALASMAWLALVGALLATALAMGVAWTTAVVALGAAHVLAATLAGLVGVRLGRTLIAPRAQASRPKKSA